MRDAGSVVLFPPSKSTKLLPLAAWYLMIYGETKLDSLGDSSQCRVVLQKKAAPEYKTSINSAIGSVINTNYSIEIKDTYS